MEAELVVVKDESENARPLTSRLDEARARLRRAEAKAESIQQTLDKLKVEHAEAGANAEAARAEFKLLEEKFKASVGEAAASQPDVLEAAV